MVLTSLARYVLHPWTTSDLGTTLQRYTARYVLHPWKISATSHTSDLGTHVSLAACLELAPEDCEGAVVLTHGLMWPGPVEDVWGSMGLEPSYKFIY